MVTGADVRAARRSLRYDCWRLVAPGERDVAAVRSPLGVRAHRQTMPAPPRTAPRIRARAQSHHARPLAPRPSGRTARGVADRIPPRASGEHARLRAGDDAAAALLRKRVD